VFFAKQMIDTFDYKFSPKILFAFAGKRVVNATLSYHPLSKILPAVFPV